MMREFVMIIIAAVLADNFIWQKCYGADGFFSLGIEPRSALKLSSALAVIVSASYALAHCAYGFILAPLHIEYLKTLVFVSLIVAVEWAFMLLCGRLNWRYFASVKQSLPLAVTGSIALAVALENVNNGRGFLQGLAFAVFAVVGVLISMLVFSAIEERVKLASPPHAFDGLPIKLVAAGLVALAFSGFYGMMI